MASRICRTILLDILSDIFVDKMSGKSLPTSIYLSTKMFNKRLPAKDPCRTKCSTNLAGKMFNKALICRTWYLSEPFVDKNAGKNCFVEQNVEQSINLSTKYALLNIAMSDTMLNKAYICCRRFLPAKCPTKHIFVDKICFCWTIVRQKAFSCRQKFRQRKSAVNKYMLCRTKCSTKHILAGKGSGKNMILSDKMFNKAYICCQMLFCWGVSCLATPCLLV